MNKHSITCATCGKSFEATRKLAKCSRCRHQDMKARAALKGPCAIEGCTKPQFCKSMCSAHYWREREQINPINREYPGICAFCGSDYISHDPRTKHCSSACGLKTHRGISKSTEMVHVPTAPDPKPMWDGHEIPARKGLPLVSGPCGWCGDTFVGQPMTRYCSKRCSSNAAWKRKYDLRGDFNPSPRLRAYICARDNWTCQICGGPVDPNADYRSHGYATLDHIIPQSMQLIPDHSAKALRLAHMICNSRRGNRMEYDVTA